MIFVKQEIPKIPSGEHCGTVGSGIAHDVCVFLDSSVMTARGSWVCRRHKNYTLGTIDRAKELEVVVLKAPPCLAETALAKQKDLEGESV